MLQIAPNWHPAVVHLPIALILVSLIFHLAAKIFHQSLLSKHWTIVGHWTLWFAAIGAILAVYFGLEAYNSVDHDDAGHLAMILHRNWALPTAGGLVLFALWDGWKRKDTDFLPWPMLVILMLLAAGIVRTAWLGGEVVFIHGIGVKAVEPQSEVTFPATSESTEAEEKSPAPHDHNDGHHHSH